MQDPVIPAADDERLIELVGAIVDGVSIDWPTATPAEPDAETSALVACLQRLE